MIQSFLRYAALCLLTFSSMLAMANNDQPVYPHEHILSIGMYADATLKYYRGFKELPTLDLEKCKGLSEVRVTIANGILKDSLIDGVYKSVYELNPAIGRKHEEIAKLKLQAIFDQLAVLNQQIKTLKISVHCGWLRALPDDLFLNFNSFTKLTIDGNFLEKLPNSLSLLTHLEACDLYCQFLKEPIKLFEMKELRNLHLSTNHNKEVGDEIGYYTTLDSLNLTFTLATGISPQIAKLQNLTYLNIFTIELEAIPSEIGQLSNLEELILTVPKAEKIPKALLKLKKLKYCTIYMSDLRKKGFFKRRILKRLRKKRMAKKLRKLPNLELLSFEQKM